MAENKLLIPIERIEQSILLIRGHRIMLDRDLAILYGVSPKVLNQAAKRHRDRFPEDFMFQLTMEETKAWWSEVVETRLRSQSVTLKRRGQHIKYALMHLRNTGSYDFFSGTSSSLFLDFRLTPCDCREQLVCFFVGFLIDWANLIQG